MFVFVFFKKKAIYLQINSKRSSNLQKNLTSKRTSSKKLFAKLSQQCIQVKTTCKNKKKSQMSYHLYINNGIKRR